MSCSPAAQKRGENNRILAVATCGILTATSETAHLPWSMMPFVIGVMGVGGVRKKPDYFRLAMAAPAALPEFQGNVVAIQTAPFWEEALVAASAKRGEFNRILDTAYTLNEDGRRISNMSASPSFAALFSSRQNTQFSNTLAA